MDYNFILGYRYPMEGIDTNPSSNLISVRIDNLENDYHFLVINLTN